MVSGGDIQKQFTHVKESLGKEIKIDQIFETGSTVDVAAITKGHGWQGTMRRWGVKKKQHKSRKTVRRSWFIRSNFTTKCNVYSS